MQGYSYSVFSLAAIAIHLIIRFTPLIGRGIVTERGRRYRGFLFGVLFYYLTDAAWGMFAGLNWTKCLYADTILFFLSLPVFIFMWCRFVQVYLDFGKRTSLILNSSGYALLAFNIVMLAANFFNGCFFSIDENGKYLFGEYRYLAFALLIAFTLLIAAFAFRKAFLSREPAVRRRNMMVLLFSVTISVANLLQVIWPLTPFTSLGCLICNCFFHTFVIQDDQMARHMVNLEKALDRARAAENAMKERSETIEKQRQEEIELRKEIEKKQEELEAVLTDLENASAMARLASFRYELKSRKRSGSTFIHTLWPDDDNGEPLRFEDWVHPEDIPIFAREVEKMEQSDKQGETATFSFRVGPTSGLRYIRALVSLDLSNPDEPAVTGILQDVTELTQSMMKLKDTQNLWDAAINAMPFMLTVKDVDNDFRYLLFNNAFSDLFNCTPNEVAGKTDSELFDNGANLDFATRMNHLALTLDVNEMRLLEDDLPLEEGGFRSIKTVVRIIQDSSGRRLLLTASSDVSELVKAKREAEENAKRALAADKAKSFFIASVSHEIRTPLNSVIGFAELLREGGVSKEQEMEYLDAVSSSANALLMLINDVLDLSKLEANQMKIITAFTDFNALCREVLLIFTFRAQENGNKLVSDVPEDLPELDIDNIRIRQILINLLGNAVKFTKNGAITLSVTFTPAPDSADTGTLKCSVSDTGIGISEEDQKKLMEPFVQLSRMRDTNAVKNGTGLGLSISKRLATCMNGELTCTSKDGEGSTFTITLNAVRCRAKAVRMDTTQAKAEIEAIARDVKAIRILIVDDLPMNLRVAQAIFNKVGFDNVFTAESGREALELLNKQPVDLILSDMWMPEMDGAQFATEVKNNPGFAHIPIVAQTADVESNGNFDMSHFDAIILKPLTKEKLSNMVKRIIVDGDLQKGAGGTPVNLG